MSEGLKSQNVKDPRSRNQKMLDEAKDLDSILGGNAYEALVNSYITQGKPENTIIKEALIDAGFYREVNGKKSVDWIALTSDSKNPMETVEKVKKSLQTGLSQTQVDSLGDQILNLLTEKKRAAIRTKVNRIQGVRAARIINAKKTRTRINSLLETWKQGGLSDKENIS